MKKDRIVSIPKYIDSVDWLQSTYKLALSFVWLVTPTMLMIVDDYAAHQTLAVSMKKPISVV